MFSEYNFSIKCDIIEIDFRVYIMSCYLLPHRQNLKLNHTFKNQSIILCFENTGQFSPKKKKNHNIVFNKYHFLCNNWKKKLITSYMLFNKLILGKKAWPSNFHIFLFQSSNFQFCQFSPLTFNFCQFSPLTFNFCQCRALLQLC